MCKDDNSFLIEYSFPNLIELLNSKKINDNFEITANVQLIHFQLGPRLDHIFIQIFVGCINKFIVIVIGEEDFDGAG